MISKLTEEQLNEVCMLLDEIAKTDVISSPEKISAFQHYKDVDEWEIALEGAIVSLIEERSIFLKENFHRVKKCAELMGLDEERSLDEDMWDKLMEFGR